MAPTHTPAPSMEPLSARIPSDLYLWLAQLKVDGATTHSDKLRVLLTQLKKQHDGALDYVAAHGWARDLLVRQRDALVRIEGESGVHSEVLAALFDHLTAALALALSHELSDTASAARLEDALVRRALNMSDSLLRQAATSHAAAYDAGVVRRHAGATIELALHLSSAKGT